MLGFDNITALMEGTYRTEYPELLSSYYVEVLSELDDTWHGNIWEEHEDQSGYFLLCGVGNNGDGNYYNPVVFDRWNVFQRVCNKCYPRATDPVEYACTYMELREAQKEENE